MSIVLGLWLLPTVTAAIILLALTHARAKGNGQRLGAEAATGLMVAGLPFLLVARMDILPKAALVILQLWLLLLPLRLIFGRLDQQFLRVSTLLNVIEWTGLAVTALAVAYLMDAFPAVLARMWPLEMLMVVSIGVAIGFIAQLVWTLHHYRLKHLDKPLPLKQLPTVSVCIPARNEDTVLTDCLHAVLASDYPKLEVIVLDDCSQDKTASVVREFAHGGVRFVQGDMPAEGWLGKNQAMHTLAAQASGDLLLFMGVDVRLEPHSISRLVHYALSSQKPMVSVLPQNTRGLAASTVFGTLQYFWQTVLPITKHHVPVSSKVWMINTDVLHDLGGFESVKHKIVPEESFARRLASSHGYRFLISNAELGMTEEKKWSSQVETSIRLLYPTFKRQPFYALMGLAGILGLMVVPFVLAIWLAIAGRFMPLFWLSLAAAVLQLLGYALVRFRTHPRTWPLGMWLLPFVLLQEAVLVMASMLRYEFGEVNWKGRNVCYPVISVAPSRLWLSSPSAGQSKQK